MITMNFDLFQQLTAKDNSPVLVEFWAPWCVYCRRITPALEKLSQQYADQITFGTVNIDDEPLLAHQEHIEVIPTLVIYQNGRALGSTVAPESKAAIEDFIQHTLNI